MKDDVSVKSNQIQVIKLEAEARQSFSLHATLVRMFR